MAKKRHKLPFTLAFQNNDIENHMTLSTILEDVLPTKWSSRIAEMTLVASLVAFPLPRYWPFSKLVETNKEILLFQVLLSVLIILIGALCCLVLVIIDYRRKNTLFKNQAAIIVILEKQIDTLKKINHCSSEIETLEKRLEPDGIRQLNELIKKLNTPDK